MYGSRTAIQLLSLGHHRQETKYMYIHVYALCLHLSHSQLVPTLYKHLFKHPWGLTQHCTGTLVPTMAWLVRSPEHTMVVEVLSMSSFSPASCLRRVVLPALSRPRRSILSSLVGCLRNFLSRLRRPWGACMQAGEGWATWRRDILQTYSQCMPWRELYITTFDSWCSTFALVHTHSRLRSLARHSRVSAWPSRDCCTCMYTQETLWCLQEYCVVQLLQVLVS